MRISISRRITVARVQLARRARLASDLLHDRDGALADERDGHRVGRTPWHATQRAAWDALKKADTSG
jgi:hypothetical protein